MTINHPWISVLDEMPEKAAHALITKNYLVITKRGIMVAEYDMSGQWISINRAPIIDVSFWLWMPDCEKIK